MNTECSKGGVIVEKKLTYVEPAEYFPKEIRDKFFKDEEKEEKPEKKPVPKKKTK